MGTETNAQRFELNSQKLHESRDRMLAVNEMAASVSTGFLLNVREQLAEAERIVAEENEKLRSCVVE